MGDDSTHDDDVNLEDDLLEMGDLTRFLVDRSGKKPGALSVAMHRGKGYLGSMMYRRTVLGLGPLSDLAEECGYAVALIGKDEAVTIMPSTYRFMPEFGPPGGEVVGDPWELPWVAATDELARSGRHVITAYSEDSVSQGGDWRAALEQVERRVLDALVRRYDPAPDGDGEDGRS